jgi:hypothetical protein
LEQIPNYGDQRNVDWCVYCGGAVETRDHLPSRILLDKPYPTNLPAVPACQACNGGFSLDEEYVACVLECVLAGSAYEAFERPKIAKVLERKPKLAALIEQGRQQDGERSVFAIDTSRVRNVILKLARGHMAFEMNEPAWRARASRFPASHFHKPRGTRHLRGRPKANVCALARSR